MVIHRTFPHVKAHVGRSWAFVMCAQPWVRHVIADLEYGRHRAGMDRSLGALTDADPGFDLVCGEFLGAEEAIDALDTFLGPVHAVLGCSVPRVGSKR